MALGLSLLDVVPDVGIDPDSGLASRTAYGYDVSLTHATFPSGYGSQPHAHESEELIRRLRRAEIGKQRVQIFKPVIDQRYAKNGIVSHSGLEIPSELVQSGNDILEKVAARTEVARQHASVGSIEPRDRRLARRPPLAAGTPGSAWHQPASAPGSRYRREHRAA